MQENQAITCDRPHTQQPGWSPDEKALLLKLAPGKPRKGTLLELFPGRSLNAIRLRLHMARKELGIAKQEFPEKLRNSGPTMLDRDDPGIFAPTWQEAQRKKSQRANSRYLEALRNAA